MTAVNITNVTVLDNPAAFLNPFQFEISYECLVPLKDVWKERWSLEWFCSEWVVGNTMSLRKGKSDKGSVTVASAEKLVVAVKAAKEIPKTTWL